MRKVVFYLIVLFMTALVFAACGGDDTSGGNEKDPNGGGGNGHGNEDVVTPELNVYLQQGEKVGKEVYPRFVAFIEKQMLAEISDPKHPELMMINYADENSSNDATMLVTEHNIFIMHHNPYSSSSFPQDALVVGDHDNYSSISVCHVNWETQEVEMQEGSSVSFSKPVYVPNTAASRRRGATEERIKQTFLDFAHGLGDVLGEKNGKLEEIGQVTKGLGLGDLTEGMRKLITRYNSLVIPSMEYILSSDEEIAKRNEVLSQLVSNNLESALIDDILDAYKSYLLRYIPVSEDDLNYALWLHKMSQRGTSADDAENLVENPQLIGNYIGQKSDKSSVISKSQDQASSIVNSKINSSTKDKGIALTLTVSNVTEEGIKLSGTATITESTYLSYSSVGFIYTDGSTEKKVSTSLNGSTLESVTVTGLEPATLYSITTYYAPIASNNIFYSATQSVVTRGMVFKPSITNIDFEGKGGQQTIDFKLGYGTSWSIVSAPKWCTYTINANSLVVNAPESEDTRTGQIQIQATNYYQEQTTYSIGVSQQGSGGGGDAMTWIGTAWELTGTVTVDGETDPCTVVFDFSRLSEGIFSVSLDGMTLPSNAQNSVSVDGAGNIEVHVVFNIYSNHGEVVTDNLTFKLIRTGESTCTGELSGIESSSSPQGDYTFAISGSFPNGRRTK